VGGGHLTFRGGCDLESGSWKEVIGGGERTTSTEQGGPPPERKADSAGGGNGGKLCPILEKD